MPELPEVEFGRRVAEEATVGKAIVRVRVTKDPIVFADGCGPKLARALRGAQVCSVHRKGKYLWFELDRRPWPSFHFGMTGAFRVDQGAGTLKLQTGPRVNDEEWPPRFTKLQIEMEDGRMLAFTNSRRLGRVRLHRDPSTEPPIALLGPDPLVDGLGTKAFAAQLAATRRPVKAALLDQRLVAGVGNWIADEVLFHAGLDPHRLGSELNADEARRLASAIRRVIKTAVAKDADSARFPRSWLFHHRWPDRRRQGPPRLTSGEPIEFSQVGGRTTAWVPSRQS